MNESIAWTLLAAVPEGIWVALIGAVSLVLVTVINVRSNRSTKKDLADVAADTKATRGSVVNDHSTDLRTDVDKVTRSLARVEASQRTILSHLGRQDKSIAELYQAAIEGSSDRLSIRQLIANHLSGNKD